MSERPSRALVFEMLEQRRKVLAEAHSEMQVDEEFDTWSSTYRAQFGQKYLIGLPKGFEAKLPGIATSGVNIGLNNIMTGETAQVTVELPTGLHADTPEGRKRAREHTAYLENCYTALLYAIDTYSTEPPIRQSLRNALSQGLGVLSYGVAWDRWPDPPHGWDETKGGRKRPKMGSTPDERKAVREWQRRRQRALFVDVQSVHPRNVFFDPFHEPPLDYIREERIGASVARAQYPDLDWSTIIPAGEVGSTVTRVMYCSADDFGVWINGEPVTDPDMHPNEDGIARNPSGLLWHRMAYGGFGQQDAAGSMVHKLKGIIRDARPYIIMKIVNLNVLDAMRQTYAFPGQDFHGGDEDLRQRAMNAYTYGPGAMNSMPDGVTAKAQEPPTVPAVVFQEMQEADRGLEIHFGPDVLRGTKESADETASGQRSRINIAQTPYRAAAQNHQQAIAMLLQDISYLVKYELREAVPIPGTTLMFDPDLIPVKPIKIAVDLSPMTEEEKAFKVKEGMDAMSAGLLSREDVLRDYMGEENPREKLIQADADRLRQSLLQGPNLMAFVEQQVLAALGAPPPPPVGPDGQPMAPAAAPMMDQQGMVPPPQTPMPEPTLASPQDNLDQMQQMVGPPLAATQAQGPY